jgi:hypothetical protein
MSALRLGHRIRAWRLKREVAQLMRRASRDQYRPSAHLTGEPLPDPVGDFSRSGWFLLAVIVAAMLAGYVIADDARIEAVNACIARR